MSFISIEYIILLAIFVPIFFNLPRQLRILFLLLISYIFYAFSRVEYIFLIVFSTGVDYFAAKQLEKTSPDAITTRRLLLFASIFVNLGVLFIFKYFNFFNESLRIIFESAGVHYNPLLHSMTLPVGISFFTFQSMAYTIDVYRGDIKAEKNVTVFASYVAMFPQLVAGPIERARNILPQLREDRPFAYHRAVSGLQLILWGVFKKIVIADRLAVYVNGIYNDVETFSGLPLLVATLFFTFQIYCDFSGYSDIAIGSARILGFDLMENFRQPYFSSSIQEFWRRWHISLSTWFRDYLYIPLGGNRVSFGRKLVNLMIVFVVSGLWHGANWTFIIWGALHGFYIVIETVITGRWQSLNLRIPFLQWLLTFSLVGFAWIFFRANSLGDAWYIITNLFNFTDGRSLLLRPLFNRVFDPRIEFMLAITSIATLLVLEWANQQTQIPQTTMKNPVIRYTVYYGATLAILATIIMIPVQSPFIYFQF